MVEITNDGTMRNCGNSGGCYINPVIHSNVTNLNVTVKTIDIDGGCTTGTHNGMIYFCLMNYTGSQLCNSTNYNFTFALDKLIVNSTLPGMQECNFTFSTLQGPDSTMPFYIAPGNYSFNVDIRENNISLSSDPEKDGKWIYTSLIAVGYTNSTNELVENLRLGGSTTIINNWNSGTDQYNLSNWGNVPLNITWNATNPTNIINPSQFWNLSLDSNRFQIDDDTSSIFIDSSLQPLNFTYQQRQFIFATGLVRCNSYDCSNLNSTLATHFHINPPTLVPGTYRTMITYVISQLL